MAPPVERMAALGAPPVGARVKVGGMAYDLVPNQLGEFQRVYLEKGGSAEVTVRYPEGKPGDKVAVAILDGGTVGEVAGETGAHRAPLQGTALALETPEKITVVEGLLAAYRASEDEQSGATRDKELTRIDRDTLLHSIRRRRAAIQHAADSLWPATEESHGPVRKTFGLPANRAMGL